VSHQTVRCASGATATSRQRSTTTAFNALQCAPESEQRQTAHQTVYRTYPVHHRTAQRPHQSELQRSEPNGRLTWLAHRIVSGGAPDRPVRHASNDYFAPTVDCNRIQCATVRARVRAAPDGTPDSLPDSPEAPPARAPTVRTQWQADVAGAPDSVRWRTRLSGAPCDRQPSNDHFWWLGL
jgi:hypothetical protein